jgi:hypothetical protein
VSQRRSVCVTTWLTEAEAALLDERRGEVPRSEYLRTAALGGEVEPDGRSTDAARERARKRFSGPRGGSE